MVGCAAKLQLVHLDDRQEVHGRLDHCVHVAVGAPLLVLAKELPEGLGLHAVPGLSGIALLVGVVAVALEDAVPELVSLQALLAFLHDLQALGVLVLALLQRADLLFQFLLNPDALGPVLGVFADGVERGLELLVLFLRGLVPLDEVVPHLPVDQEEKGRREQKLHNAQHRNIAEQLFKLVQSSQNSTSYPPAASAKARDLSKAFRPVAKRMRGPDCSSPRAGVSDHDLQVGQNLLDLLADQRGHLVDGLLALHDQGSVHDCHNFHLLPQQ